VPIRWGPKGSGSEFLGVLDMVADRPAAFGPADVELLGMLATQAALAIQNARLFQAEREQRELAEVLRNAAQVIASSLDLDDLLGQILEQLREIVVYDTASVLALRRGDAPDLILGMGYVEERMTSRKAGKLLQYSPILHQMARDLQTVILDDVRQAEGWIWVPGAEHIRSFLAIPLVARRQMIGALMMDHSLAAAFAPSDARNARALAQHAAQALENALPFLPIAVMGS
jgi:GAF domain-containing protein